MLYTLNNLQKMNVRTVSNILFAFINVNSKLNVLQSYSKLYKECQVYLALQLRENHALTEIDINQIIIAYSKTQNYNSEFLQICEAVLILFNTGSVD